MTTENAYQETLDYLYSYVDYSLTRNLKFTNFVFNLDRMEALALGLGSPEKRFPIVHIAGTKGKGSTGAFIAGALHQAGYKVGFYTSPHMEDFCERIQINRSPITHQRFVEVIEKMKPVIAQIEHVSTFDIATATAFEYFAEEKVDIAVVEVGLGGRLDSTNIVSPLVSVITALSMDHMNVLGDTLEKIAAEKGGIIKPACPVISSPQKPGALNVLQSLAAERNAPLTISADRYPSQPVSHSLTGQKFALQTPSGDDILIEIPLLGDHQRENAVTAFAVLQELRSQGYTVPLDAILEGFRNVKWPGRFEIVHHQPLVVLDSAHNLDSAIKLKETLLDYLADEPIVLVFGASEDKDVSGMFSQLLPIVEHVVFTQSIHPRSYAADRLIQLAEEYPCAKEYVIPLEAAMQRALTLAGTEKVILVTGSIFVAAGAQIFLDQYDE